ncbi:TetR/AcrR family transcriptional regulator [Agromyces protaetiae]|uniref:TetR/AcrR family transcriptional regulator n=1 Tax=Agromyces protaetiae TaxID=2509455 RepID=A0A4P6FEP2_9MICO|nr:TetR/AcrR family transcriptional regulator [Agromyces protaetiae]QAY72177.1 TetR/AcrR family transcriptional regulator [Agromyces protaetiae]
MTRGDVAGSITRAAVELFAAQGYAPTSVAQIVAAAGVTKGAMYHYFQSKDDLLFGIYDRILALQQERLDAIVERGGDVEDVLRAVCEDVLMTSIEHLDEGIVFFQSQHLLSPERRAEVARRRRSYHDAFAAILRRGRTEGRFRSDVPEALLVAHFFSDVHYLAQWYSPEGPQSADTVAGELAELYLASLRPTPAVE